jgi:thymidylate synthase (FAD)
MRRRSGWRRMKRRQANFMEKGHTIKVLDHGYVKYLDHMGTDQDVLSHARISYKSEGKGETADKKLLEYLYKNKHTSPFEMVKIKFGIKLPIFVMRQYVRHRMQNLNEVSARYTELPNEFYIPKNWRKQDTKNKQGSINEENWNPLLDERPDCCGDTHATEWFQSHCSHSYELYELMLQAGIAREMARMVLPINIYTECHVCWDLKNLLHFISLRDDSHAQSEIQEYGQAMKKIVSELFPWTMEAYEKYKFKMVDTTAKIS